MADRKRLAKILGKAHGRAGATKRPREDEAVIAALRAWVDKMEKFENPKRNSSAKTAERIRKANDRGFKL